MSHLISKQKCLTKLWIFLVAMLDADQDKHCKILSVSDNSWILEQIKPWIRVTKSFHDWHTDRHDTKRNYQIVVIKDQERNIFSGKKASHSAATSLRISEFLHKKSDSNHMYYSINFSLSQKFRWALELLNYILNIRLYKNKNWCFSRHSLSKILMSLMTEKLNYFCISEVYLCLLYLETKKASWYSIIIQP